jgi:hypothetical protein
MPVPLPTIVVPTGFPPLPVRAPAMRVPPDFAPLPVVQPPTTPCPAQTSSIMPHVVPLLVYTRRTTLVTSAQPALSSQVCPSTLSASLAPISAPLSHFADPVRVYWGRDPASTATHVQLDDQPVVHLVEVARPNNMCT